MSRRSSIGRSLFSLGILLSFPLLAAWEPTKPVEFALDDSVSLTNAIPLSLGGADLGGDTNPDIVMGYRSDATSYTGGVRIYYMDGAKLPAGPVDPSGGTVTGMVPAINVNNFNYGVKPSLPSLPYLTDIAAGIKTSPTTGALVIFLR